MKSMILFLFSFLFVNQVAAQAPPVWNLYEIAYNGSPVTVDADLSDWQDAQWLFLSQDWPHFVEIQGLPTSPSDFSVSYAMKMDDNNLYIAVSVRDEGTPMVETFDTPNMAFNYDHLSVYLGLYDIGTEAYGSPHQSANFKLINSASGDTVTATRTYRIAPEYDNTGETLGPDYQLMLRALPYGETPQTDDAVQTYNGAYVDTTIPNTAAAGKLFDDGKGYILEWKIPFASLAGKIANQSQPFANFEWPLFEPEHGKVIVWDADITDDDDGDVGTANTLMRFGGNSDLWRDSKSFGMRARIVDLSQFSNDIPRTSYYINHRTQLDITIDADLSDWNNVAFYGLSQDSPLFTIIQGIPESPADFSGFIGLQMDDENIYLAAKVRDEGVPMNETVDTPNMAFDYDHVSLYLGLYDIADAASSPHIEGASEGLEFYDPVKEDTIAGTRTYRIRPSVDNMTSTLGADYRLLARALDYEGLGIDQQTYSGAYIDTTVDASTLTGTITPDGKGWILEWKIPFSALAGNVAKPSREFKNFDWPLYTPVNGDVIVWDADITDRDSEGSGTENRFLRVGDLPALWRDSKSFKMRGKVTTTTDQTSSIDEITERLEEIPNSIILDQNYPNPFNPATTINYGLKSAHHVRLSVVNLLGQKVAVLVDGSKPAGTYSVKFDAARLSSGIYFYKLEAGSEVVTRKMTLIK